MAGMVSEELTRPSVYIWSSHCFRTCANIVCLYDTIHTMVSYKVPDLLPILYVGLSSWFSSATHGGLSTSLSAHDLSLNVTRPLEEIALILMIDFLAPPLVTSLIVPRADRTRTEIKRLSPGLFTRHCFAGSE
jgi:hypothetical protein